MTALDDLDARAKALYERSTIGYASPKWEEASQEFRDSWRREASKSSKDEVTRALFWIRESANSICGQSGNDVHQSELHRAADLLERLAREASRPSESVREQCVPRWMDKTSPDSPTEVVPASAYDSLKSENMRLRAALQKCALVLCGEAPNKSALVAALNASRDALEKSRG